MKSVISRMPFGLIFLTVVMMNGISLGEEPSAQSKKLPDKVYVPYEQLKGVFEKEQQGIFLPYQDFFKLWQLAQGTPAGAQAVPAPYLISVARYTGKVGAELAVLQLELTIDILADGWVEVPIGLKEVAVAAVSLSGPGEIKTSPLLHVDKGRYMFMAQGKGKYTLKVEFVRQLESRPGLKVLSYSMPSAAINTLELVIPEENVKVDIQPMLAATTSPETVDGRKATKLQAFLGTAESVNLSWQPRTQAAAGLEAVVIADQIQYIEVSEALVNHEVHFVYDIRRHGVDSFTIQLPGTFRVTGVEGANISKWDLNTVTPGNAKSGPQILKVNLYSPAEGRYELRIRMERFLKEAEVEIPLMPVLTQQALRQTGLLAITHSARRSVEIREPKGLARVDIGRLPEPFQKISGVTAYRFITADYGGILAIGSVKPRITVQQLWSLGVDSDRMELHGQLNYQVERSGVFSIKMNLPEPWQLVSVGPQDLIEDFQLSGKGQGRTLGILLKREVTGPVNISLLARAPRASADEKVNFVLPLSDEENLQLYTGKVGLFLADQLRAEVENLNQLQSIPVSAAKELPAPPGLSAAMAFEFRTVDRKKPVGTAFKIEVKPTQISAVVHRLVNIQSGTIDEEAVIDYHVLYSPVDTFFLKMPVELADMGVEISGADIKEKPRMDGPPEDEKTKHPTTKEAGKWAWYKIVTQTPVIGKYSVTVSLRRGFRAEKVGQVTTVVVSPILAAGKLSDQTGEIAVAKADTLAVGQPTTQNLIPADPASATDLPYDPHRRLASLAFKYTAPPYGLSLPVARQEEAAVFTTIANGIVIEQVITRDGTLNTHAVYILSTSKGDRLPITLPVGAKLFGVTLNGAEIPVEAGTSSEERIVRLPPTAGQISRIVLEISYGLDHASASTLTAPGLPVDIPVQQSLWRLWVPAESYVLAYDRNFTQLDSQQAQNLLNVFGANQPSPVNFKLPPQGKAWDFIRQGRAQRFSVTLVGEEVFSILVLAIILIGGIGMLWLTGYTRAFIILTLAASFAFLNLFVPLLIEQILKAGLWAILIVAGLWFIQWAFFRYPKTYKAVTASANDEPRNKE